MGSQVVGDVLFIGGVIGDECSLMGDIDEHWSIVSFQIEMLIQDGN